ncbi:MAG: hypothetical protein LBD59_07550 [Prevotellaceae bacterium]|jgi:hypothetical protein|nr:hypothetical protein [Prevotellaceae bacterium]
MKIRVFTKILAATFFLFAVLSCSKKNNEPDTEPDFTTDPLNCLCETNNNATVLQVGANKTYKTVTAASEAAGDNSIIEIDAGTYKGDVALALWTKNNLVIRAVGGEVILDANGKYIDGKGIWDVRGVKVCVDGITFMNDKVPEQIGAGIRLTSGNLTVINCRFLHNEMGILTANEQPITLTVRNSEFGYGGYGNGFSHNIYVGHIGRVDISGCWFHHADKGHLIKSRAAISHIYSNLIFDGTDNDARASYSIDIPSGGQAVIVGNIIQKSPNSEQMHVLNFATEFNDKYTTNQIFVAHNTIINNRNSSNNRLLNAPSSKVEIYLLNNAIPENTHYNDYREWDADKGNVVYQPNDLTASNYPVASLVSEWKSSMEKNINSYLPNTLKNKSLSLVPSHQYDSRMQVKPLSAAPAIPGAVQTP